MKERGIIMSGDNPRLILEGRKTQTRRIITPQPTSFHDNSLIWKGDVFYQSGKIINDEDDNSPCPYGAAGDRLWVRETFNVCVTGIDDAIYTYAGGSTRVVGCASGDVPDSGLSIYFRWVDRSAKLNGKSIIVPSIHMPRWASRITLEITNVRVEQLRCMTDADAMAEGMNREDKRSYSDEYHDLWDSLHGNGAWNQNPWVWVLEFKLACSQRPSESVSSVQSVVAIS